MQGVEIVDLEKVKEDERGVMLQFDNKNTEKLLLVKRKKGTISAAHYHTGKNPEKFPKMVVIMDGEVEVILKNLKTGEEFREIFRKPVMLKIWPYVYHELRALTDIVVIDMNSIDDYKDDTIKGLPE